MKNCKNEEIIYSNSYDGIRSIGEHLMRNALATGKNGTQPSGISEIFYVLEKQIISASLAKSFIPELGKKAAITRIETATNAFFNIKDTKIDETKIKEKVNEVIELELSGGPDSNTETIPAPPPIWKINETLMKVHCIRETSGPGDDEIYLTGLSTYNGNTVANKDWSRNDMDTGESVGPINLVWGPAAIIKGEPTIYKSTYLLFEDDLMGKEESQALAKLLGELAEAALEAAKSGGKIELEKHRPSGISDDVWGPLVEVLLRLIIEGALRIIPKLVDLIGSWLGPESFSGVFLTTTINFDGVKDPTWQTEVSTKGKKVTGKLNTGAKTDRFIAPYIEEGKNEEGFYKTEMSISVFKG